MIGSKAFIEFSPVASLMIYFGCFGFSLVFVKLYTKNKSNNFIIKAILVFLIIFPIFIMQGFRYNVGTDYVNYTNHFYKIGNGDYHSIKEFSDEPLFLFECKLIYNVFHSAVILFVVNAAIMNILFFIIVKNTKEIDMVTAYIMYYLTVFPAFLNIERQGIACLCLWMGFLQLYKQKYLNYLIWNLLGSAFHSSALMFLPFVFLGYLLYGKRSKKERFLLDSTYGKYWSNLNGNRKKENKWILAFVVGGLMLSPLYLGAVLMKLTSMPQFSFFSKYLVKNGTGGSMKLFFWGALLVINVFILKLILKSSKKFGLYEILALFTCVCCLMDIYVKAGIGTRMLYFTQYGSFFMAGLVVKENKRRDSRLIFKLFILASCLFYFVFLYYVGNAGEIFPYCIISM